MICPTHLSEYPKLNPKQAPVLASGLSGKSMPKRSFAATTSPSFDSRGRRSISASSTSSNSGSPKPGRSRSTSLSDVDGSGCRTAKDNVENLVPSKRMRKAMGYTDVSPGGFDDSKELLEGRNLGARYGGDSSQTEFLSTFVTMLCLKNYMERPVL